MFPQEFDKYDRWIRSCDNSPGHWAPATSLNFNPLVPVYPDTEELELDPEADDAPII